jgi:magnesium chelatase family protein
MSTARTRCVALIGIEGHVVEVEAYLGGGLPAFGIVGLPDKTLNEARDRVRAAVVNSNVDWPQHKITIGLSPATLPKSGSHFDIAIATAVLVASDILKQEAVDGIVFLGELGLNGRARHTRGILPSVLAAANAGYRRFVVPEPNVPEARLIEDAEILGIRSLRQLLAVLRDDEVPEEPAYEQSEIRQHAHGVVANAGRLAGLDLAEVVGQAVARKALEVAAAGGHHLSLTGPPGGGKTMLAERLPTLLPDLDPASSLEVSAIHSVAGALPPDAPLITRPPFCDPHHTVSTSAIVGGGPRIPRPGSISLAHHGVLFLDEAPEFKPEVLETLRQPLEHGEVVIARSQGAARFPAKFQLVLASNPCPCGKFTGKGLHCICSPIVRQRYAQRLSGPIRDRIDIVQTVEQVSRAEMTADRSSVESSETVRARVEEARARQACRYQDTPWTLNAQVPGHILRRTWPAEPGSMPLVDNQLTGGLLTARGADRVLRIAWSIADLAGRDRPTRDDVMVALTLRLGHEPVQPRDTTRRVG